MTRLITALYKRMLLATILILVAVGLCAVAYLKGDFTKSSVGYCGTKAGYTSRNYYGNELFLENCASCHNPFKESTGPALAKLNSEFPKELLYDYIRYPEKTTKKNKYLRDLEKKYGIKHPGFPTLTNAQIDSIFDLTSSYRLLVQY